jgi:uncharacterized 2Fe-2S/4Fe-4S cluster protein (DUF4445 family)
MVMDGFVLACQAMVDQSIIVKVPKGAEESWVVDYSHYLVPEAQIPVQGDLSPLSEKIVLDIAETSLEESSSDLERLACRISKDCQACCSLSVLRVLPQTLRQSDGTVTATVVQQERGNKIIKLDHGVKTTRNLGIACDLGTTTVALKLVDLNMGRVVDNASSYNDQIKCGADIISRIIYAQKHGHLQELNRRIVRTINRLLDAMLPTHNISPHEVTCGVFSGNTTMVHLLLGIDPKYIREEPYVPAVKFVPLLSAKELKIAINPDATIFFTPSVGSYVGGDITAGVLCTQIKRENQGVELFIDIGTNGELVLIGNDWMIACACSAGPAFEGVGIKCGMRASSGAIEAVSLKKKGAGVDYRVIGGSSPRGVCGSGLIELVAELFSNKVIDRDGKFDEKVFHDRIRLQENHRAFVVARASQSATRRDIYISEMDIENIMRAKGAIFSACSLLLKKVGLSYTDIERVYVAGAFGRYLNIEKAIAIGLFPDIEPDRFHYLGNTSLLGAYLSLLSSNHRQRLTQIARSMTYVDLSSEPNYMNEYTGALFFPHTDENLFPNVKKLRYY